MTGQVLVSAGGVCDLRHQVERCPRYCPPVVGGPVAACCAELICAKAAGRGWPIVAVEIMPDRVRLLVKAHLCESPSRVACQSQGFSWRYLGTEFAHVRSCLPAWWSRSYCAATVGAVPAQTACWYTGTQTGRPWWKERVR
ncbi:MAG TPA: transposase [Streptosporangiaceae bacterium]|nr:transposase [Streptosporangiaceae bacterium]